MKTNTVIQGVHHVTATVNEAQADYDFYTKLLGLRLVKKTVNFDNNSVYHLYYGDKKGTPGTIFTTFPYQDQGVRKGTEGTGMISATAFSIPAISLEFWKNRLENVGITVVVSQRFGQQVVWFRDPADLQIELITDDTDTRTPFVTDEISNEVAIRGIHHVTLWIAQNTWEAVRQFLVAEMNMEEVAQEENRIRLEVKGGQSGNKLELLRADADTPRGKNGIGTVHHVAWKIADEAAQLALRHRLADELGIEVTEVKDRKYFRSIYFRLPSHQLFEVATAGPGFDVDESIEELGMHLMLPEDKEYNRAVIEAGLPDIQL
ncbi:VOC family protein [Runella sp.]|uniref:VOC family protein n=1 Tax=Runella sp. TaxID=1960881 RepID=UPI003D126BE2